MKISESLLKKYNVPVPRYTSYPPANFFRDTDDDTRAREMIRRSDRQDPRAISLYLHIPFCPKLCSYCGCNTRITHDRVLIREYVDSLKKEILLVAEMLDSTRQVTQVHWGGGTPNYLPISQIEEIMSLLQKKFSFAPGPEIAMECHPAQLTKEYASQLVRMGFNRISLGIQDFNTKVLNTVRRDPPKIPLEEMIAHIKSSGTVAINLDFIYGLPFQNVSSFLTTIRQAINISPDRMVTFSYAHVPWIRKAQKVLEQYPMPGFLEKARMFIESNRLLRENGYVYIGLDHYARPDDELSIALQQKKLHRNFQGYCTRKATGQVYAFGTSAISQLADGYFQNTKSLKDYFASLSKDRLPVRKEYSLNDQERWTGRIIDEIMCNLSLDWPQLAERWGKSPEELKRIIHFEEDRIKSLEDDHLVEYANNQIHVTENGRFFLRNIAAAFDPNLTVGRKRFSQAI